MIVDSREETGDTPRSNTTIAALEARVVQLIEIAQDLTERAKEIGESCGRMVEDAELLTAEMRHTRALGQGENDQGQHAEWVTWKDHSTLR